MLSENGIRAAKEALRERCLAVRRTTGPEEAARIAQGIRAVLAREFPAPPPPVAAFRPVRGEPDILPWLRELLAAGLPVAFPVTTGPATMVFRRVSDLDRDFTAGRYGIPEPRAACPEIGPTGLVLVPGLAFASDGGRLGYGAGYYDRLLAGETGLTVGICPEALLLEAIPANSHDRAVSYICTESRLLRCRR